ncbi:hypothetical protein JCM5296_003889 [Sporobolomyces johnsonii]
MARGPSDPYEQPQPQDFDPRTADRGGDYSYAPSEEANYGYGLSQERSHPEPGWNADYSLSSGGTTGHSRSYSAGYDEPTSRVLTSDTAHSRSSSTGITASSGWRQQPYDHDLPPLPPPPPVDYTTAPLAQQARMFGFFSPGVPHEPRDFDPNDATNDSRSAVKLSDQIVTPSQVRHETRHVPSEPKETRQGSVDEEKTSGGARRPGNGKKGAKDPAQRHEEYDEKEQYGYDGKASTVDLVDSLDYSSERKGDHPEGPVAAPTKKGGPAISKGEVSHLQSAVREANIWIQSIADLYMRYLALPSAEDSQAIALKEEQADATTATRALFTTLRNRLHVLDQGNANLRALIPLGQSLYNLSLADVDVRQQQVDALKDRFKEVIQHYAEVERDNRAKHRARLAKQVRIVNPILTQEEIDDIVQQAEAGDGAVFAQAVHTKSYRSHAARGALREVESRAAELARIEQTLIELAQLFQDMAVLVESQHVAIVAIEADAAQTHKDMEVGLKNTKSAVVHARSARKKRWCFFFIFLVLFLIVAVVVVVIVFKVILPAVHNNHTSSATPAAQTKSLIAASAKSNIALSPSRSSTSSPVNTPSSSTAGTASAASTTDFAASTYTFARSEASSSNHTSSLSTASGSRVASSSAVKHSASVKSLSSTKRDEEVKFTPPAKTRTSARSRSSVEPSSFKSKSTAAA